MRHDFQCWFVEDVVGQETLQPIIQRMAYLLNEAIDLSVCTIHIARRVQGVTVLIALGFRHPGAGHCHTFYARPPIIAPVEHECTSNGTSSAYGSSILVLPASSRWPNTLQVHLCVHFRFFGYHFALTRFVLMKPLRLTVVEGLANVAEDVRQDSEIYGESGVWVLLVRASFNTICLVELAEIEHEALYQNDRLNNKS